MNTLASPPRDRTKARSLLRVVDAAPTPEAVLGLCWPALGGPLEAIAARSIARRRDRCLRALGPLRDRLASSLGTFVESLGKQTAFQVLTLFDDAWPGALFVEPERHLVDDVPHRPTEADALRWLLAAFAEGGPAGSFAVSPAGSPALDYLYFPRLKARLTIGGAAVAVFCEERVVQFILDDGKKVTLPRGGWSLPPGEQAGGLVRALPHAAALPLLGKVPFFRSILHQTMALEPRDDLRVPAIEEGWNLLGAVWPAARAFAERWLRGMIVLRYLGHARSHTSVHAPQVLICSAESGVKVAEALCHELAHARMLLFLEENSLFDDEDGEHRHPSPWRRDKRPLLGLLNGVHAFLNVCALYRRLAAVDSKWRPQAAMTLKKESARIDEAWTYLRTHARWTPAGATVALDFERAVADLASWSV